MQGNGAPERPTRLREALGAGLALWAVIATAVMFLIGPGTDSPPEGDAGELAVGRCVDGSYQRVVECESYEARWRLVEKAKSESQCRDSIYEEATDGTKQVYCVRPVRDR